VSEPLCAYCGDVAEFQRIDGTGRVFCCVCAALAVADVEPESEVHLMLRPYKCTICGKRTASDVSCARSSCMDASAN
jgi:hypothetical protein